MWLFMDAAVMWLHSKAFVGNMTQLDFSQAAGSDLQFCICLKPALSGGKGIAARQCYWLSQPGSWATSMQRRSQRLLSLFCFLPYPAWLQQQLPGCHCVSLRTWQHCLHHRAPVIKCCPFIQTGIFQTWPCSLSLYFAEKHQIFKNYFAVLHLKEQLTSFGLFTYFCLSICFKLGISTHSSATCN